jgi:hypothetical protein
MCDLDAYENVLYHFWSCPYSQRIWNYMTALMKRFAAVPGPWEPPDWKHALFVQEPPRKFQKVARLWLLLHGVTMWLVWISHNHFVFNQSHWNHQHVTNLIWRGIGKYA